MPIQDLTPQLRTRLSHFERAVGWFITIATLLLLTAFGYYIYNTASRKGWFKAKVYYSTGINNVTGLKVGDQVRLMGYNVGQITEIEANEPWAHYGITVKFNVVDPYYGYIWRDSKIRLVSELLGNRYLEIVKGYDGAPTVHLTNGHNYVLNRKLVGQQLQILKQQVTNTNLNTADAEVTKKLNEILKQQPGTFYTVLSETNAYWISPLESPALSERLEAVVDKVELALPGILSLTNQVYAVLTNANAATSQLQATLAETRPTLTNLAVITSNLRDPNGSLGNWLIPTNMNAQIEQTMQSANETIKAAHTTIDNTDTNITALVAGLDLSLKNLANLTSNLNSQVQANTNIVSEISSAIVHTDDLIQGLKRHWLLRSAFKTNKPPAAVKQK